MDVMMIDPYLLDEAITNVAKNDLYKRMREWFVYNAPNEFLAVLHEYERLDRERDEIRIDE